jgi:hypothetical protein
MSKQVVPGIHEFLRYYPRMAIKPLSGGSPIPLSGVFDFSAKPDNGKEIIDSYSLRILVPAAFPRDIPEVTETRHKIPRNSDYHVNSDGTLCLGSPLRLLWQLSLVPTLVGFAEKCLVPYLYAISYKLQFGADLPFNELQHGTPGELSDYADLFGLKEPEQARAALRLLTMKKRDANKYPCPCGCGRRLGKCSFNDKIRKFRNLADRNWFRSLVS